MPRHNPTLLAADDEGSRHGRRLERDQRARSRRRARRQQLPGPDDLRSPRTATRRTRDDRELDRQVADWRGELALQA